MADGLNQIKTNPSQSSYPLDSCVLCDAREFQSYRSETFKLSGFASAAVCCVAKTNSFSFAWQSHAPVMLIALMLKHKPCRNQPTYASCIDVAENLKKL